MKEILEALATANTWNFNYGREDFQNLYDEKHDPKVIMFVDPIISKDNLNERSQTESVDYQIRFLFGMSSKFGEKDYEVRYQKYIKPLTVGALKIFKDYFICSNNFTITSLSTLEVINSGDFNADGLLINCIIRNDLDE